ncbi:MAG: hypothetical protein KA196_06270 [Arenimonas sp.]|nr:hypothetical protein [Arenimonas sp.]
MKKLAAELFTIVFGVLIALGFDGWRQDREELRVASEHLSDIAAELRNNLCTVERIVALQMPRKFDGLQTVLDFLNHPESEVADPAALLQAFVRSTSTARPWLVDNQYQALQNSGNVRLLRKLAPELSLGSLYEGPDVLFAQEERIRGAYPMVVNQLIPAQLQSGLSLLKSYANGAESPMLVDNPDLDQAIEAIRERRLELLALARSEAAVATARWYALSRASTDLRSTLEEMAPWDKATTSLDEELAECRTARTASAPAAKPN